MIRMDDATPNHLRLRWDVGDVTAANFGRLALLNLSGSGRPLILTESFAGLANWPRVYPRVCGGTSVVVTGGQGALGLSPRVRGNLLRENWDAVRAFLASAGQWRMAPNGHRTGLNYAAAKATAQGLGIRWWKVFEAVAVMEVEALRIWATSRG